MKNSNVLELQQPDEISDPLSELLRNGAKDLIRKAVEAELQELLSQYNDLTINGKQDTFL